MPQPPIVTLCAEPILNVPEMTGSAVLYGAPIFTVATENAVPEIAPDEIELVTCTLTIPVSLPVKTNVFEVALEILLQVEPVFKLLCHW